MLVTGPGKRLTGVGAVRSLTLQTSRGRYVRGVPSRTLPRVVFIAEVLVSDLAAAETRAACGMDPAEIVSLVQSPVPRIGRWVHDARGARLYLRIRAGSGRGLLVALSPIGSDAWRLASVYVQPSEHGASWSS
jgi:hypothetical protein